jgi:hypothetical protein
MELSSSNNSYSCPGNWFYSLLTLLENRIVVIGQSVNFLSNRLKLSLCTYLFYTFKENILIYSIYETFKKFNESESTKYEMELKDYFYDFSDNGLLLI